jgi:leucyl aminopeptidase
VPNAEIVALGWCLELYRYDPYREVSLRKVALVCPKGVDRKRVLSLAAAAFQVRDLINTPANLLGPAEIESAARGIAKAHSARLSWRRVFR